MAEISNEKAENNTKVPAADDSSWDIQSILGDALAPSVYGGAKAGYDLATSKPVQNFFKDVNVCEPKTVKDYVIGAMTAGFSFVHCSTKALSQDTDSVKRPADSK